MDTLLNKSENFKEDNNHFPSDIEIIASDEVIDTILDLSWKEYQQIFEHKRDLDLKSSIILSGVGILIGLLIHGISGLNLGFMYIGGCMLCLSALSCFFGLILRSYNTMNVEGIYKDTIDENELNNSYLVKQRVIEDYLKWNKINKDSYTNNAHFIEFSLFFLIIGIFLLFFSFILGQMF
jgi:hypothetical protein